MGHAHRQACIDAMRAHALDTGMPLRFVREFVEEHEVSYGKEYWYSMSEEDAVDMLTVYFEEVGA
jgi:hypothetical protein